MCIFVFFVWNLSLQSNMDGLCSTSTPSTEKDHYVQLKAKFQGNKSNKLWSILICLSFFFLFIKTEKKRNFPLKSLCLKIKDSFGVSYKDHDQPLWAGFSALNLAELPSFSQPLLKAMWTNYPRNTCSYFSSVSAQCSRSIRGKQMWQRWKGETNAGLCHISHLSGRFRQSFLLCQGGRDVNWEKGGVSVSKNNFFAHWMHGHIKSSIVMEKCHKLCSQEKATREGVKGENWAQWSKDWWQQKEIPPFE